ncbi:hypothetical protein ACLOJK_002016 [Asimina triloba]
MLVDIEKSKTQENEKLQSALDEIQLQFEETKEMMAAMEESKTQENVKLQSALNEMQLQFEETKEMMAAMEESKTRENVKLQSALNEMQLQFEETKEMLANIEESKAHENTRLQSALDEMRLQFEETKEMLANIEESKTQENVRLQSSLDEMQLQLEETKEMLANVEDSKTQENARLQSAFDEKLLQFEETKDMLANIEESKTQENARLQSALNETLLQFEETKEMVANIEESKTQENARLQSALDEMQLQYEETKEMVAIIEESKTQENARLQSALDEMQLQYEETKEMLANIEESKTQENARLQSAMDEIQLQFEETKEMLMKEQEVARKAAEQISIIKEVPVVDDVLLDKLTAENEKLKAMVSSLEKKIDETERKHKETNGGSAIDQIPITNEAPVVDNVLLDKLAGENENLEAMVSSLEKKIDERKHEETHGVSAIEQTPITNEAPVVDHVLLDKLAAENENLKAMVSSLEKKIDETERKHEETYGVRAIEKTPTTNEASGVDNVLLDKLAAENENLKAMVSCLEKKINETERKLAETNGFSELKQTPVTNEVPSVDKVLLDRLTAENENLKAMVNSLETKIDETERKCEETQTLSEIEQIPIKEVDNVLLDKLTAENENQKAMVSSLERKIDETERKHEETNRVREIEQSPLKKEVPDIDNVLLYKLTAENENLKSMVSSLEKKIDETERKYEETNRLSEERLKQAMDSEEKILQLQNDMQRLEEKLHDMESKEKALREEISSKLPLKRMSGRFTLPRRKVMENGHLEFEDPKGKSDSLNDLESERQLRRIQLERQHENLDALIKCVAQNIGFSNGKPVAAFTIYKCLLHWKSFEAERTSVFDRLIQMIGSVIEGFRSSSSLPVGSLAVIQQVEAKYPALLFKEQVTAYVEKIFGIIRDNLKNTLTPLLGRCAQTTSRCTSMEEGDRRYNIPSDNRKLKTFGSLP